MMNHLYSKTVILTVVLMCLGFEVFSKTTRSNGGGDWHTAGTWDNGVPIAGDVVYIENGDVVTVSSANAFCSTLNIEDNGSGLTISSNTLTIFFLNVTGTANSQSNAITVNGSLVCNNTASYKAEGFTGLSLTVSGSGTGTFKQNFNHWATLSGSQTLNWSLKTEFVKVIYMYCNSSSGHVTFNLSDSIKVAGVLLQAIGSATASDVMFNMNNTNAIVRLEGTISPLSAGGIVSSAGVASKLYTSDLDFLPDNSNITFYDVILATTSSISANRAVNCTNDFIIPSGITLTTGGSDLSISGDLVNNGTITMSSGDVLSFDGSSAQSISSASDMDITVLDISNTSGGVSVTGSGNLNITEGITFTTAAVTALTTGGKITLKDNGSGMAYLGNTNTHTVSGNLICEFRTQTLSNIEYRMLSMPVSGVTLGSFDYNSSNCTTCPYSYGYAGSQQASAGGLASSYTYNTASANSANDFNSGWAASTSDGNSLNAENAVTWYMGPGTGSFSRSSYSVDVSGPPNTGAQTLNLTFSSSGGAQRNWALVGNPYPSTVNFANVTQNNVDKDPWLFKADNGGYGIDNTIPPFQAFFVKTTGTSPSLVFNEDDKVTTQKVYQKNFKVEDEITIKLSTPQFPHQFNYTYLRFDNNATNGFDAGLDKDQFRNGYPYPNVSLKTTDSKNTYRYVTNPNQDHVSIPLNAHGYVSGSYELSFANLKSIEGCVILEDTYTNTSKSLTSSDSAYSFNLSDTTTGARFILHLYNMVDEVTVKNSTCYGDNSGEATLKLNNLNGFITEWYDEKDNMIHHALDAKESVTVKDMKPGKYSIKLSTINVDCPNTWEYFTVHEPLQMTPNFSFGNQVVSFRSGKEIKFKNLSEGGIASHHWDFGDNTNSTQINPSHTYTESGIYEVQLTASNGNSDCDVMFKQSIEVAESTGMAELSNSKFYELVQNQGQLFVNFNSPSIVDLNYRVFDIQGKELNAGTIAKGSITEEITVSGKGIVLINLNYNNEAKTVKLLH